VSALPPGLARTAFLLLSFVAGTGLAGCRHRASTVGPAVVDGDPPYAVPDLSPPLDSVALAADGRHGWTVGAGGAVMRSEDGGRSWRRVEGIPGNTLLRAVAFSANGQLGVAVGDYGSFMRSRDGGLTWEYIGGVAQTLSSPSLRAVAVSADGTRAWVAGSGGTLLVSSDGTATWRLVPGIGSGTLLEAIGFSADGRSVWAAGDDGVLVQSADGGATWAQAPGIVGSEYLSAVSSAEDGRLRWAVGDKGAVYESGDSGATWRRSTSVPTLDYLNAVTFSADGQKGWVAGDSGTLLLTTDRGAHWEATTVPTEDNLYGVAFAPDGRVGCVTTDSGSIFRTEDGGRTWERVAGPPRETTLTAVCFAADNRQGWAVGLGGTILGSHDGGATWVPATGIPAESNLLAVTCTADGRRAWGVGAAGLILRTVDGGSSWHKVAGETKGPFLHGVAFAADGSRGWAVGTGGTILNTSDGGATWQRHAGGVTAGELEAVFFLPDGLHGWAAGEGGTVLLTTDGGQRWEKAPGILTQLTLRALAFAADGRHGLAMGDQGTKLTTADGGRSWQTDADETSTSPALTGVAFAADGRRGWAVGNGGLISRTVDGGSSWWGVASDPAEGALHGVAVSADGRHVWAVGNGGTIRVGSSAAADRRDFPGAISETIEVHDGILLPVVKITGLTPSAPVLDVRIELMGPNATGDLAKGFVRYFTYGRPYAGWKASELGSGVYTAHVEVSDGWNVVAQDFQFGNGPWARLVGYMGWDIVAAQPGTFVKEHGTRNLGLLVGVYVVVVAGLFAFWPAAFVYWHERTAPLVAVLPLPTKATDKVAQLAGLFLIGRPRALDAVVRRGAPVALAELAQLPEVASRPRWVAAPLQIEDQLFGTALHPYEEPAGTAKGTLYVRGLTELRLHLVSRRWWLSVEGPGGVGKSAFAFQVARWFAAPEPRARIGLPQAIPLLIRSPKEGLDAEVLAELKRVLDLPKLSSSLSGALLRQRRVLALIDGLSEKAADLESMEQDPLNPAKGAQLTAFAVLTSRRRVQVVDVVRVIPRPVDFGTMDGVLDRYLEDVVGAGRFTPDQRESIREALKSIMKELAVSAGQSPEIPMVFVKLLVQRADQVLGSGGTRGLPGQVDPRLPHGLGDLVDGYQASLLETRPDIVSQAVQARQAALACVGPEGLPEWRPLAAYAARGLTHGQLEALVTAGLLVKDAADVGDPRYKFVLDPIADYLAAKELVLAVRDGQLTVAALQQQVAAFATGSDIASRVESVARALGVAVT